MNIAHCIGCGCHDYHACHDPVSEGPCSWLAVDYEAGVGVCSACPDHLSRWTKGDRRSADQHVAAAHVPTKVQAKGRAM